MYRLNTASGTTSYATSLGQFCAAVMASDTAVTAYSQNYIGGHSLALQNTFPGVHNRLGTEPFAALARVYVQHNPPLQWDLNLYGESFSALLAGQTQGGRASDFDWPWLAHLARIEYAISQAYYADDQVDDCSLSFTVMPQAQLSAGDIVGELQRQHLFADIDQALVVSLPVIVRREGLRVAVGNKPGAAVIPRAGSKC